MKKNVFISYSSKESSIAHMISDVLEKNGITCWIAPESIAPGFDYSEEIPRGIEECDVFLLLLSENAQASVWVKNEMLTAVSAKKEVIPFVISKCEITKNFQFALTSNQYLRAYEDMRGNIEILVKSIKRISEHIETGGVLGLQDELRVRTIKKDKRTELFSKKTWFAIVGLFFAFVLGIGILPKISNESNDKEIQKNAETPSNMGQDTVFVPSFVNNKESIKKEELSKQGVEDKIEENNWDKPTTTSSSIPHYHDYEHDVEVIRAVDCLNDGQKKHSCSCGDYIIEMVYAYNHSFDVYYSDGNADCTKDGTKTAKCSNPGCKVTDTKIDVGSRTRKHVYCCECDVFCDLCGVYRDSIVEHSFAASSVRYEGSTVIVESQCDKCGYIEAVATSSGEGNLGLGEGEAILGGDDNMDDDELEIGSYAGKTEVCHEYSSDCDEVCNICRGERIPLGEHSYVDVSEGNEYNGYGMRTWRCIDCGDEYDEVYFEG